MKTEHDGSRAFLRHAVATLAYRGAKAISGVQASFAEFKAAQGGNSPLFILRHIGDLLEWSLRIAKGDARWQEATPVSWEDETTRFFAGLKAFDDYLASEESLAFPAEKIFQGAIADALTHVGQIAALRRLSGNPMKAENYFQADIVVGRVGPEQTPAKREFD